MICSKCGEDKPQTEFYAKIKECKECTKRRVRERARTNPSVQEYDRRRAKRPDRKAKARKTAMEWRENNPIAYKAQTAVSNAVRDGRLFKLPCEFCGETEVHAHHRDYSKPLDVVWLCPKSHHRLHAIFPELEGRMKG